jgi:hypothetical protein
MTNHHNHGNGTFAYPTMLTHNISVKDCSPSRKPSKYNPNDVALRSSKEVAKKPQPSAKHSVPNALHPLEVIIMKYVGEAHALGISLNKEHLCKLSGYQHSSTKMYTKALKSCKGKGLLVVKKNLIDFTLDGMKMLKARGELPSPPTTNEYTMKRINVLLEKLELEQTGFDILHVLVKRHSQTLPWLTKNELAVAVSKAPTTKSFSKSITFLSLFGVLERASGKYSITKTYSPFNETK